MEEALSQLQLVQDMTQRNASVVRNISLLLRPTMLDDLGLFPALKWLAREVSRTTGIHVDVVAESGHPGLAELPEDLPEEHRTCVYRVVQEAVHNAARHSAAHQIRVYLQLPMGRTSFSCRFRTTARGLSPPAIRVWEFWGWKNGFSASAGP